MPIIANIHKALNAKMILNPAEWNRLNDYFSDDIVKHGVYLYLYKDSKIPYYIGKCNAKTYHILGRVWDELSHYKRCKWWIPKDVDNFYDANIFRKINFDISNMFNPQKDAIDSHIQTQANKMIDNTIIYFSYITNSISEVNKADDIYYIENTLQDNLVKNCQLVPKWIGDAGQGFTSVYDVNETIGLIYTDESIPKLTHNVLINANKQ